MAQGIVVVGSGVDPASYYNKTQVDNALAEKLSTSGGALSGFIDFGQKSNGFAWKLKNGDVYNLRPYVDTNVFQLVRIPADGTTSYGAFNIYEDGHVEFARHSNKTVSVMATIEADGVHAVLKGNADTATKAGYADSAGKASSADTATNANHATSADTASNAGHASSADTASYAETAGGFSGGSLSGYLDFGQTNAGLSWTCANGDIYHFRAYSPSSIFLMTRQNPSGLSEYGVFNVYADGRVTTAFPGASEAVLNYGVVASGSNYLRFGDGTQICWGAITYNYASASDIALPVPFSNTSYAVSGMLSIHSGVEGIARFGNKSISSFRIIIQNGASSQLDWIAIGRWA